METFVEKSTGGYCTWETSSSLQVHGLEMLSEEENYPMHFPHQKFSKDLLFSASSWEPRCCMDLCFDLGPSCVLVRPSDIRSP